MIVLPRWFEFLPTDFTLRYTRYIFSHVFRWQEVRSELEAGDDDRSMGSLRTHGVTHTAQSVLQLWRTKFGVEAFAWNTVGVYQKDGLRRMKLVVSGLCVTRRLQRT